MGSKEKDEEEEKEEDEDVQSPAPVGMVASERAPGWRSSSKGGSRPGCGFLLTQPVLAQRNTSDMFRHWYDHLRAWFHTFAALQETHAAACTPSRLCPCCPQQPPLICCLST